MLGKGKMELRRDIYMAAIEATVVAMSAIGSLCEPTTSRADVTEKYGDAAAKIGKASSIAQVETVRTLGKLTDSMRALYTRDADLSAADTRCSQSAFGCHRLYRSQ
ncbi:hypothetical protein [Burkholderia stagnalis]|uniref:hypothetical protein n=1 Tax=Burkholderia stagnalis TaxID=1503054 RepID=UPI0012D86A39|nr:hypothetical protein [Burkholderia stagnalis]